MKTVRNASYITGMLVFCIGACFADSCGYGPLITVMAGTAIMGFGILIDLNIGDDDSENEK